MNSNENKRENKTSLGEIIRRHSLRTEGVRKTSFRIIVSFLQLNCSHIGAYRQARTRIPRTRGRIYPCGRHSTSSKTHRHYFPRLPPLSSPIHSWPIFRSPFLNPLWSARKSFHNYFAPSQKEYTNIYKKEKEYRADSFTPIFGLGPHTGLHLK